MQLAGGCVGGGVGRRDRGGRERLGRLPLLFRPRQPRQDEEHARRGPHGQVRSFNPKASDHCSTLGPMPCQCRSKARLYPEANGLR